MTAYYNEFDPYAAQWLRNLIQAGHIAPGYVDERSILDVTPADLAGYTQCHFFAGVGVWSHALRGAGWADESPVWTGSCPCQPFSSAGAKAAFADERHLWPHFHWLIEQCQPAVVLGEQVASKDAAAWLDLVQADMEATGYAFGAVAFPAASVGAPHIRDRLYWMADAEQHSGGCEASAPNHIGPQADRPADQHGGHCGTPVRMADAANTSPCEERLQRVGEQRLHAEGRCCLRDEGNGERAKSAATVAVATGPTNGFWRNADWLLCRDGKWRPVEPGTFPLVNGASARVGRLRAYGNAICAPQAQLFIEAVREQIAP